MKAVLYKDWLQLWHNAGSLVVVALGIGAPLALVALVPLLGLAGTAADAMYRIAVLSLAMTVAPTLSLDAIRGDFANGTIVSVRACGRPFTHYLAAQLLAALVPITALSLTLTAAAYLGIPVLRASIAGPQGAATAATPTLVAFALYLWSTFIKGKAMIMTTTTLSPTSSTALDGTDGTAATASAAAPPAIRVRDMTFGYRRGKPVLEHIDLDVPVGQSLGILGYNGVGKTTLLSLVTGLLRPWHGSATINADVFHSMREVFQLTDSGNLSPTMTIRENLRFRAMLYATHDDPHPLDLAHLDQLPMVRAFELGDHLDTKVKDLSSGLKKRAGIVAGMLFDPRLILLDEPTNAVDPITRQLLVDLMRQLKADGRTILTVTHDLDYCWEVTDRVIILDDRHLVKDCALAGFGTIDEFKRAATLGRGRGHVDFGIGGAR